MSRWDTYIDTAVDNGCGRLQIKNVFTKRSGIANVLSYHFTIECFCGKIFNKSTVDFISRQPRSCGCRNRYKGLTIEELKSKLPKDTRLVPIKFVEQIGKECLGV